MKQKKLILLFLFFLIVIGVFSLYNYTRKTPEKNAQIIPPVEASVKPSEQTKKITVSPVITKTPQKLAQASTSISQSPVQKLTGNELYVSPTGNDKNNGTTSTPFKTIQKAISLAQPGDTINLSSGEYVEDLKSVRDGKDTAHITIKGSKDAIVKGRKNSRIFEINHSYITLDGFTIDGKSGNGNSASSYKDKLLYVLGKQKKSGVTGLKVLNMTLQNGGGECVRLRYFAQNNEIAFNTIKNCGVHDFRFNAGGKNGEAIYIGTAPEQLKDGKNPTKDRDESNNNWIHHNTIDSQGNECVDVKEAATGNIIEFNSCTGQKDKESGGMDSRGSGNIFRKNTIFGNEGAGIRFGGDKKTDGLQNDAYDNEIKDNRSGGIKFQRAPQGKVCGNTMSNNTGGNSVGTYGSQFKPANPC